MVIVSTERLSKFIFPVEGNIYERILMTALIPLLDITTFGQIR